MKQHKWKIVAGISVIIFLVVVVVAFLGNDKNNNLDLSAFKTDSISLEYISGRNKKTTTGKIDQFF